MFVSILVFVSHMHFCISYSNISAAADCHGNEDGCARVVVLLHTG
jgi:hypothetical protein